MTAEKGVVFTFSIILGEAGAASLELSTHRGPHYPYPVLSQQYCTASLMYILHEYDKNLGEQTDKTAYRSLKKKHQNNLIDQKYLHSNALVNEYSEQY